MQLPRNKNIFIKLFLSMLYISSFTFGGGFVIVTFMKRKFVDELRWIEEAEMLDFTALAQSSPGAIAVNCAILMGWRVAGFWGMLVAVLGTILPPMIILTAVSFFYEMFATNFYVGLVLRGMQAAVAAVILDVVCSMGSNIWKQKNIVSDCIMLVAFFAVFIFHVNVIYIILSAMIMGIIIKVCSRKEREKI